MSSRRSLELLRLGYEIGYRLLLVPCRLVVGMEGDHKTATVRMDLPFDDDRYYRGGAWRPILCDIALFFHSILVTSSLLIGLVYDLTQNPTLAERAQFYCIFAAEGLVQGFQVFLLRHGKQLWRMEQQFYRLVTKLNKLHKLKPHHPDGIEQFLFSLMAILFAIVPCSFPTALMAIYCEVHALVIFSSTPWKVKIVFALLLMFETLVGYVMLSIIAMFCLVYVNAVCVSLRKLRWKPGTGKSSDTDKRAKFLRIYRAHQVMQNYTTDVGRGFLGIIVAMSGVIQIVGWYVVIAHHSATGPFFTAVAGLNVVILFAGSKLVMQHAGSVDTLSKEFAGSYLRNEPTLTAVERLEMKASRAMQMQAGQFLNISESTFPNFMFDLVVARVLDLLLM